jgi:ABC-type dipeptide/oligopeptide/nickel transport system permease component
MLLRLTSALFSVWLAATLAFFALRILPGDAIETQILLGGGSTQDIVRRREQLGLDASLPVQYCRFFGELLTGDLGSSLIRGQEVTDLVLDHAVPTITLAFGATVTATTLGIVLGLIGGSSQTALMSRIAKGTISLSVSAPIFWTSTLAIYLFSVQLNLLPATGTGDLKHLILPVAVLAFHTSGVIGRIVAVNFTEIRGSTYILAARAKGLHEAVILRRHMLRLVMIPTTTAIALQTSFLLSGTVITESIFARPGLGRLLVDSAKSQDYPVVEGIVIVSAVVYNSFHIAADRCGQSSD